MTPFTVPFFAVIERADLTWWHALLLGLFLVPSYVMIWASTRAERAEPAAYCRTVLPVDRIAGTDLVARCTRLIGHNGLHRDHYYEVSWTTTDVRCGECGLGLFSLDLGDDTMGCDACGCRLDPTKFYLNEGESLVVHRGRVAVAVSVH